MKVSTAKPRVPGPIPAGGAMGPEEAPIAFHLDVHIRPEEPLRTIEALFVLNDVAFLAEIESGGVQEAVKGVCGDWTESQLVELDLRCHACGAPRRSGEEKMGAVRSYNRHTRLEFHEIMVITCNGPGTPCYEECRRHLRKVGRDMSRLLNSDEGVLWEKFSCSNPSCSTHGARENLQRCSRCKTAQYCSAKCQKMHWPVHPLMHNT